MPKFNEISFSDDDIVNPDDWIPAGPYSSNPHGVRPFLLHDHGFVVAIVFADCLQDAIDEAADAGKLERFALSKEELEEYRNPDGSEEDGDEFEGVDWLGNFGEPHDIEGLDAIELPNPPASWCAQFEAMMAEREHETSKQPMPAGANAAP